MACHVTALVHVLAIPLLVQLPASVPQEAVEDSPDALVHATHVRDWKGVPGSWVYPSPVLGIAGTWGVNQVMEVFSFPFSAFLIK